jgi:tRNA dimethylallyltransferase
MIRHSFAPVGVIVGPTASGKSTLAHQLARRLDAGIVSADAFMVYRGMDIGTAKPSADEQAGLTYLGLDLVEARASFTAYSYLDAIRGSVTAGRWLVVGGTGLYIRALLQGLTTGQGGNVALRAEAEQVLGQGGPEALFAWCRARDAGLEARLPEGDRRNPRRWIRALERGTMPEDAPLPPFPSAIPVIGLHWEREALVARISARVEAMLAAGWLDEVGRITASGGFSNTAVQAIGYRELLEVHAGRLSLAAAREQIIVRTRQYAKRQMTWFRGQVPMTTWLDGTQGAALADEAMRLLGAGERIRT